MFANVAMRLSPAELLVILVRLRAWALGLALLCLLFLPLLLPNAISVGAMSGFVAGLALWQGLAWWRNRQAWPVTEWEVTLHLLADSAMVMVLMLLSGGSASPFVSLILVPIGLAAAALPAVSAWLLLIVAASGYSLLIWSQPPHAQHGGDAFFLHVLGMWVTFLFAALLLVVFVSAMAAAARKREAALAGTREQMMRAEQLTRIGSLAAGAAHELGTPLSTAKTLLADIRRKAEGDEELDADLRDLAQQVDLCADRLKAVLVGPASEDGDMQVVEAREWLSEILNRWRAMRPTAKLQFHSDSSADSSRLRVDESLGYMLTSLLDNAADASASNGSTRITLQLERAADELSIHIDDQGQGLSAGDRARAGRIRFSSKADGHGLGLVLSHATMDRFGGQLRLSDRPGGGTRSTVSLPLPPESA